MSLASDRPEFTPPASPGRLRAIGLALLAHVLLIAALTWGVNWKRESSSSPVQAELWSATTQEAAPALVEPAVPPPEPRPVPAPVPPPPPKPMPPTVTAPLPEPVIDPQIAIEHEKKKKADKKKKEQALAEAKAEAKAEEARQEALDKKKRLLEAKKAEAKKLAAQKAADDQAKKIAADKKAKEAKEMAALQSGREAQLKRIAGLAGASGGESATGSAKQSAGPSAGYSGRISARLKSNIVFPGDISGNPIATVVIRTSPDGTILGRTLIKSSGVKAWDEAVLRAIDKTEVLPRDIDGRVPPSFEVHFGPQD